MLIWRGLGILIIPLFVVAVLFGIYLDSRVPLLRNFGFVIGFALAALSNWGLWRLVGQKPRPAGGPPPLKPPRRHSLLFIPAKAWTWIFLLMLLPVSAFSYLAFLGERDLAATPGGPAFEAADKLLFDDRPGTFHGNTNQARETARIFSMTLRVVRETFFSEGSDNPLLTKGEFLTYCHINPETVVFLCHVPEFRNYANDGVRDNLMTHAWALACAHTRHLGMADPKVVVGLRGVTGYSYVVHGKASDETPVRADFKNQQSILIAPFAQSAPAPVSESQAPLISP